RCAAASPGGRGGYEGSTTDPAGAASFQTCREFPPQAISLPSPAGRGAGGEGRSRHLTATHAESAPLTRRCAAASPGGRGGYEGSTTDRTGAASFQHAGVPPQAIS